MSDDTRNEATEPAEASKSADNDGSIDLSKLDSVDKLPKWAQDELKRARQDAANYRTRLNSVSDELRAKIEGEFNSQIEALNGELAELKAKAEEATLWQMKLDAALEVGVSGKHLKDFAERLRGTTFDELKADAEQAMSIYNIGTDKATDPTAGLGGNGPKTKPEDAFGNFIKSSLGW